jgi:hypothetical protein
MVNYTAPAEYPYEDLPSTDTPVTADTMDGIVEQLEDGFTATTGRVPRLEVSRFGAAGRIQAPLLHMKLTSDSSISNNTNQILTNGLWTVIEDTDSIWDTTNSLAEVPITGLWRVRLQLLWQANLAGTRWSFVLLNGTNASTQEMSVGITNPTVGGWETDNTSTAIASLTAGDELRAYAYQDSGGALNLLSALYGTASTTFTLEWVGPS